MKESPRGVYLTTKGRGPPTQGNLVNLETALGRQFEDSLVIVVGEGDGILKDFLNLLDRKISPREHLPPSQAIHSEYGALFEAPLVVGLLMPQYQPIPKSPHP